MARRTRLSKKMKKKPQIGRLTKVKQAVGAVASPENVYKAKFGVGAGSIAVGGAIWLVNPFAGALATLLGMYPAITGAIEGAELEAHKKNIRSREAHIKSKLKEYLYAQERKAEKARKTKAKAK